MNEFDIKGRVLAQAFWTEMEKIARFNPTAISAGRQTATRLGRQIEELKGLYGTRVYIPLSKTRKAYKGLVSRKSEAEKRVKEVTKKRSKEALSTIAREGATSGAGREALSYLKSVEGGQPRGFLAGGGTAPAPTDKGIISRLAGGPVGRYGLAAGVGGAGMIGLQQAMKPQDAYEGY